MAHMTAVAERSQGREGASAIVADENRREVFGALTSVELTHEDTGGFGIL